MSIAGLLAVIESAEVPAGTREVADALWLTAHMTGAAISPSPTSRSPAEPLISEPSRPPALRSPDERARPGQLATPEPRRLPSSSPALLHATTESGEQTAQDDAVQARSPAATLLPGALGLLRAMRPLKRTVPSSHLLHFDEEATADRIASDRLVVPVLRPESERWLTLTLVVDSGRSMVIWDSLIDGLRTLFERLGAFRDVRVWFLNTDNTDNPEKISVYCRRLDEALQHSPAELLDPTGRQVILVVSDCTGDAWRSGAVTPILDMWGRRGPLAILQPLPQRLWTRTALVPIPVDLHTVGPGSANHRHRVDCAFQPTGLPVPLLEIEDEWLGSWSKLVSGAADGALRRSLLSPECPRMLSIRRRRTPGAL